ncbi:MULTISPECIES: anhydro-N-acetylmuramic acid kinase [unclassified Psychrobacter]|uniref:anhydro-N-acetylmuramic acid kinase n=1 Tax=unclassified Psychrobacter TaxID=196806 RepID=UPI000ED5B7B7|nr:MULTISPECIES: anhydro-N-acetylmuramic acid kinase [unclassified Psychrobacter]MBE8610279.1 anhydro-N-acetylmuramic acid kinase [Pseudomonas lundensis]HCI76850.1 anhydro-N-acetylmuramic acid kinase [Psychrobacter sp.]
MTNPASIADTNDSTINYDDNLNNTLDKTLDDDLNYATLTDALEQTVFENFDDGLYIGMMSGTSLDGMDAVLCQFGGEENTQQPMRLLATHSQEFPPRLREVLLALCQPNGVQELIPAEGEPNSELDWFGWASKEYAEFASEVVNNLLQQSNTDVESVLAIGCHGQTVRHRPQLGFSLQLVDANIIAERTGISVVSDFRRRDMAVGGQGAPLVPAFHQALFATPDSTRVLLNLGGIANITVLPASDSPVIGYDTGPANLLLDAWTALHTDKDYDAGGTWAQSGQVVEPLFNQLIEHPFFARTYPKSTGREDFNLAWLQDELQKFDQASAHIRYSSADVQATLTELTAMSASMQINMFINAHENSSVYVCGGGALNDYLMTRLQAHLPHCTVETTASLGLNPAWVEAVAFAWLARQTLIGETGNLPAVTGASKGVVLGQVCFA